MRVTRNQLRRIIREELNILNEQGEEEITDEEQHDEIVQDIQDAAGEVISATQGTEMEAIAARVEDVTRSVWFRAALPEIRKGLAQGEMLLNDALKNSALGVDMTVVLGDISDEMLYQLFRKVGPEGLQDAISGAVRTAMDIYLAENLPSASELPEKFVFKITDDHFKKAAGL
jgi:uncharacterized protein (DUF2342 family)